MSLPALACPCGAGASFAACCGRYVDPAQTTHLGAPTAEALMRSRYTAFTRNDSAYLSATWHLRTRPADLQLDAGNRWLGLLVKAHTLVDDDHAEVEFVARWRPAGGGAAVRLHERSRFERADGRWFYVDGDLTP